MLVTYLPSYPESPLGKGLRTMYYSHPRLRGNDALPVNSDLPLSLPSEPPGGFEINPGDNPDHQEDKGGNG